MQLSFLYNSVQVFDSPPGQRKIWRAHHARPKVHPYLEEDRKDGRDNFADN